ncbi:hypothetical protein C7S15_7690 [Burkholderia cepacia]|nr:hypothetical protein [Burkholderia cepacia]
MVFSQHKPLKSANVDRVEEVGPIQLENPEAQAFQLWKQADFFFMDDLGKAIDCKVAYFGQMAQRGRIERRPVVPVEPDLKSVPG